MKDIKCVGFEDGREIQGAIFETLSWWEGFKSRNTWYLGRFYWHHFKGIQIHETKTQIVLEKQWLTPN